MTVQEAIDLLENLDGMIEDNHNNDYDTAFKIAKECMEKQIPKKPIAIITDDNEYICSICPNCEQVSVEFDDKYCRKCGQKIGFDWKEGGTSD